MKIAIYDPYLRKFSAGMENWWLSQGHEVRMDRYYNPEMALWADLIWFETADNNLTSATNPTRAILDDAANFSPWDLHDMDLSQKQIVVRAIDIEVWQGAMEAPRWDVVDDLIFIAPHIRGIINEYELPERREDLRIHTIPHAIDLNQWTFKEREKGFDIAVVAERWMSKGEAYVLQIAKKLQDIDERYKIHWLGQRSDYQWEHAYFDDFIEHHKLNIEITNICDSVDDFLENKNFLLHASHKEAFSAATAEAMAKGIKPILHRFYGADDLWPGMTWDTIDQAVAMILSDDYDSKSYRQYLIDHEFTLPQMMRKFDELINKERL